MMWVRETRPSVGLRPTIPLIAAGQVTDPSVSVPIAAAANPAATAEPDPALDPQALRLARMDSSPCRQSRSSRQGMS